MNISDVMSDAVETTAPDTLIDKAREQMKVKGIHHLVVMRGKDLLGLVSARDLGRRRADAVKKRTVSDVMSRHVLSIDGQTTLARASFMMRGRNIHCLVVLEKGRLAGIVTPADLLGLLGLGAERRPRADTRTAIHHRVAHRHRSRGDGTW